VRRVQGTVGKRRTEQVEGSGVFGAMLVETGWFLIPDSALTNPLLWWDWRRRLHAWLWLSDRDITRAKDLYDAWHVVKFLLQETSRPSPTRWDASSPPSPRTRPPRRSKRPRARILEALRARLRRGRGSGKRSGRRTRTRRSTVSSTGSSCTNSRSTRPR
jgi:hypothetical protein